MRVKTHFVSFSRPPIRVEFAIPATSKNEARLIAEKEARVLKGYRFQGVN